MGDVTNLRSSAVPGETFAHLGEAPARDADRAERAAAAPRALRRRHQRERPQDLRPSGHSVGVQSVLSGHVYRGAGGVAPNGGHHPGH
ncbi:hypothetical protein pipiens_019915 [Culex pipiens pipiens]|uniref:Uncharacterized protein n=1 Tax=Culex pipiens pipiens TaxID=38569 RepID=A0ABD1DQB6_CULPP